MNTSTAKNNRRKGHQLERDVVKDLKAIGFDNASTSRYSSRETDDNKIDLCGISPLSIQCKSHTNFKNPIPVIKEMPDDENFNILVQKVKNKGTYAVMKWEDLLAFIDMLKVEKII